MQCSVSRAADLEHVLHVVVDLPEGGPPAVLPVPALPHQAVHAARAPGRTLHPVPALKQLKFKNMYYKYTIGSIVCEASCHSVTRSLGHSVSHIVTIFNIAN